MKTELNRNQTSTDVLEELRALVSEAERILEHARAGTSADSVPALRARLETAKERLGSLYQGTREKVVARAKDTDEAIRENPYQTAGVALGAGLLVGVLLGRRWD